MHSPSWPNRSRPRASSSRSWCARRTPGTRSSPASGAGEPPSGPACARFRRSSAAATIATAWYWRWPRTSPGSTSIAVDQARGYAVLSDELDLTQAEIARRVGKSRAAIANTMRLLDLPDSVLDLIAGGSALRRPRACRAAGRGPGRALGARPAGGQARTVGPPDRGRGQADADQEAREGGPRPRSARWTMSWRTWSWTPPGHRSTCARRCGEDRAAAGSSCISPTAPSWGGSSTSSAPNAVSWAD